MNLKAIFVTIYFLVNVYLWNDDVSFVYSTQNKKYFLAAYKEDHTLT